MYNILLVDNEATILSVLSALLKAENYNVKCARSGKEALDILANESFDLLISDIRMTPIGGMELLNWARANRPEMSVIMLTAYGTVETAIEAMKVGAFDYVTKPFSPKVLLARIRRIMHRTTEKLIDKSSVKIHEITINPERFEVLIKNKPVKLTLTEFNILAALARRPGMVFTRYQIVDAIHDSNYLVTDRAIDVQIVALRRKLGQCGKYIETVRGIGYRFKD